MRRPTFSVAVCLYVPPANLAIQSEVNLPPFLVFLNPTLRFGFIIQSTTYPRPNHTFPPRAGSSVLVSAGLPVRLPRPKRSSPSGFAPVQWLLAKNLLCASPASSFVPLCASFVPLFACSSVVSRFRSSVLSWLLVPRSALCPPESPLRYSLTLIFVFTGVPTPPLAPPAGRRVRSGS